MLSECLKGVISQTLCKKVGGGRVAAFEVLLVNASIANLIREGKVFQIPSIMQTQKGIGNVTLNDALFSLVKAGTVDPKEAYIKSVDKVGLKSLFERHKIDFSMDIEKPV
jgi:twitching motility protein PilT